MLIRNRCANCGFNNDKTVEMLLIDQQTVARLAGRPGSIKIEFESMLRSVYDDDDFAFCALAALRMPENWNEMLHFVVFLCFVVSGIRPSVSRLQYHRRTDVKDVCGYRLQGCRIPFRESDGRAPASSRQSPKRIFTGNKFDRQ